MLRVEPAAHGWLSRRFRGHQGGRSPRHRFTRGGEEMMDKGKVISADQESPGAYDHFDTTIASLGEAKVDSPFAGSRCSPGTASSWKRAL
jgi:hypothetical protein